MGAPPAQDQQQQQYQQQYPQQYQQQHQEGYQQQQGYQSPAPLDNTYQPPNNGDHIQPVQHHDTGNAHQYQHQHGQPLPPSYDQAKASPMGQPAQGQPPATVIPLNMLGPEPQWIDCPFCHQRTKTMINKEGSSMQIVVGAVLCFVCICLTCLPCILHWFENTEYRCSQCKNMVAIKRSDAPIEVYGPQIPVYSQYGGQQQPMNYGDQQQHQQQQYPQQQQYQQHEMQNMQPQQPSPAAQQPGQK